MSAMKSLPSKGQKLVYLGINLGAALSLPDIKNLLAERVLSEGAVINMLALERTLAIRLCCAYLSGRVADQRSARPKGPGPPAERRRRTDHH